MPRQTAWSMSGSMPGLWGYKDFSRMIPLHTDSPLRSTPWMNWLLIGINVAAFVGQGFLPPETEVRLYLRPANLHLYEYFSYAFLHGSLMHLLGNMLFLYVFGNNVNDKMGNFGYLAFYLAGGVIAGVGHVVTGTATPVLGASGAVAAVTGAYMVLFPQSHITLLWWWGLMGTYEIPSIWFILIFFAKDVILQAGAEQSGVAHMAHIWGTLFGFSISLILLLVRLLPRDQADVVAMLSRWNRRRQYRDIVSRGYDPFDPKQKLKNVPVHDPNAARIHDLRGDIADAITAHDLPKASQLYAHLLEIDSSQVLARQAQLDLANQLASQQEYEKAAIAYELFLKHYPKFEQLDQVELMLGLVYARYLNQHVRAKEVLLLAMAKLHGSSELLLAQAELDRIQPMIPSAKPNQT